MEKVSKITIPELEKFGFSSMNAVKAFWLLFGYEIGRLKQKYPVNHIDNLHGYKTSILDKLMHSISTYVMVVDECQDYVVACLMVRNMIDSISAFHLIYHANNHEKVLLRHYLYILDGVSQKLDIASRHPLRPTNKITKEEYNLLEQNLSFMRNNLNQTKDYCINAIRKLNIYQSQRKLIEKLIIKRNWKFKSFEDPTGYKWSELHGLLPSKCHDLYSDYCDYLSQHVHGLSISNLSLETSDKDLYEPLSANVVLVLYFIHSAMINDFDVNLPFLTEGFIESPNFDAYCSYLDQ